MLCYSPLPHEAYPNLGTPYRGDLQRWNWRYMVMGLEPANDFDQALMSYFNDFQRTVMTWEPAQAVEWFATAVPAQMTDKIAVRMAEAQARLFPPLVAGREGNVISVNFGRKRA